MVKIVLKFDLIKCSLIKCYYIAIQMRFSPSLIFLFALIAMSYINCFTIYKTHTQTGHWSATYYFIVHSWPVRFRKTRIRNLFLDCFSYSRPSSFIGTQLFVQISKNYFRICFTLKRLGFTPGLPYRFAIGLQ